MSLREDYLRCLFALEHSIKALHEKVHRAKTQKLHRRNARRKRQRERQLRDQGYSRTEAKAEVFRNYTNR